MTDDPAETVTTPPALPAQRLRPWWIALLALIAFEIAALALAGWFEGAMAVDTPSYLVSLIWPEAFAGIRHPLYAVLLRGFDPIESHLGMIAASQAAYQFLAAAILFREASRYGLGGAASFALAAAAVLSQSLILWGRSPLPEAPAMSSMVIAFAATFRCASGAKIPVVAICAAGLFGAIAYFLRPVFLSAVLVLPALALVLSRLKGRPFMVRRAIGLAVALFIPFLVQAGIRAATVGDFNIVSFGGFQMAATAGLMIEPQDIERYPESLRATAADLLQRRIEAEQAGRVYATPLNSTGQRSFASAAVGYFDIYARTLDNYLQGEITKTQRPGESWVEFNKRMQAFSLATLRIAPGRWFAWTVGGTSRFVGRVFVTNAPFVLFALAFLALATIRLFAGGRSMAVVTPDDWLVVSVVAAGWAIGAIVTTLLVTFPGTRYIDTAGLFLPSLALLAAIAIVGRRSGE